MSSLQFYSKDAEKVSKYCFSYSSVRLWLNVITSFSCIMKDSIMHAHCIYRNRIKFLSDDCLKIFGFIILNVVSKNLIKFYYTLNIPCIIQNL